MDPVRTDGTAHVLNVLVSNANEKKHLDWVWVESEKVKVKLHILKADFLKRKCFQVILDNYSKRKASYRESF